MNHPRLLRDLPMKFTRAIVDIAAVLVAGTLIRATPAMAHSWYPKECCGVSDCAPADAVVRRSDGSYLISVRDISVLIPTDYEGWQGSPDGRIHICVSEYVVFCAFRGPAV